MRSVFLKIFLWFWLATVLVGSVLLAFDSPTHTRRDPARREALLANIVSLHAEQALKRLEEDGPTALRDYCRRLQDTAEMQLSVFDPNGVELTGRGVRSSTTALVREMAASTQPHIDSTPTGPVVAVRLTGHGPEPYVAVAKLLRGPLGDLVARPLTWAWRLAAVIAVGGVVCYALARYLSAPLRKLSAAPRQFAEGDLSVRVTARTRPRRDEIGDLARDFDFMAERVAGVLNAQRRLLRDISHELRSPLARLNVALELARNAGGAPEAPLARIGREAERLNDLIGQLLTLAGLESGAPPLARAPIDLAALTADVVADGDFEAQARGKRVELTAAAPATVDGAAQLLRSAVENVVRNAVAYTADQSTVMVRLERGDNGVGPRARLVVRDRGPGVPADALPHIFEAFYRVAAARERDSGGAGLGLTITHGAVAAHGGAVTARNLPEGGLEVTIELPCRPDVENGPLE